MALSKKHHYLPQFYLQGFTNESGRFSIYDYRQKRVQNKEFHPSTYFYDSRNFIEVDGLKDDLPEKMYSLIDDRHCELIKKLQAQTDRPNLSIDEMLELQQFVASIFWRLPSNDAHFRKEYIENPEFTGKMVMVNESGEIDEEVTRQTIFHDAFIRSIKPFMPLLLKGINRADLDNWQFVYNSQGDFTCSDEPILFREENPKDIFTSEFIFPLSKNLLLIRTFKKIERYDIPGPIMYWIKLWLFAQGNFYCCCADKEILESLKPKSLNLTVPKTKIFEILQDSLQLETINQEWLNNRK